MIRVTFEFNDIAAASQLFAKLSGAELAAVVGVPAPPPVTEQAPGKPSAARTARSQPTAVAALSPTAPSADAPATVTEATPPVAAAASAPAVSYPDLQKAVLTLHKMDPTAAVPIAKGLGADTFKLLPEAKWADALRLVNEAIESRKVA